MAVDEEAQQGSQSSAKQSARKRGKKRSEDDYWEDDETNVASSSKTRKRKADYSSGGGLSSRKGRKAEVMRMRSSSEVSEEQVELASIIAQMRQGGYRVEASPETESAYSGLHALKAAFITHHDNEDSMLSVQLEMGDVVHVPASLPQISPVVGGQQSVREGSEIGSTSTETEDHDDRQENSLLIAKHDNNEV